MTRAFSRRSIGRKIISWGVSKNVIKIQLTSLDISTGQLSRGTEVDTDELTL
jgi:hypothetical protein